MMHVVRSLQVVMVGLTLAAFAHAAPPKAGPTHGKGQGKGKTAPKTPAARPAPAFAFVPVLERIGVWVEAGDVVVEEDVRLTSDGTVLRQALEFFASFPVPGPPRAVDARVIEGLPAGLPEALRISFAPHLPRSANLLLGSPARGGWVMALPEALVRSATGDVARVTSDADRTAPPSFVVRLRVVWPLERAAPPTLVLPLGAPAREPIPVARIEYTGPGHLTARYCGQGAKGDLAGSDERALAVFERADSRAPSWTHSDSLAPAPHAVRRTVGDQLCLRVSEARPSSP
jgi:hypothetical protein